MYKFIGKKDHYYDIIFKLNSNCPDEEKVGSGPGSCGGSKENFVTEKSIINSEKSINSNLKKSNQSIGSLPKDYAYSLRTYISASSAITKELIAHPNSNRQILDIDKMQDVYKEKMKNSGKQFFNDYDMRGQARESMQKDLDISDPYINNDIAKIDAIMKNSKLEHPLVVYSGTTPSFFDGLPKEIGNRFKLCTFISTSLNPKVANGFAKHAATVGRSGIYAKKDDIPSVLEILLPQNSTALLLEDFVNENFNSKTKWLVGGSGRKHSTGNQKEVLINRNSTYKVIGIETNKNIRKLILEVELNE